MPPVIDPCNIYSADGPGDLSPAAQAARPLIYVPNSLSDTVDEIDPATYQIVREFAVGSPTPARRAVVGPEDVVGHERPGQQPDPDRSRHR